MDKRLRVLLVEDDQEDYLITKSLLLGNSILSIEKSETIFQLDWVQTYDAGLQAMKSGGHDAYLVDYQLGARTGLELLQKAVQFGCRSPIILLTGRGSYEVDMAAMQAGAADYLVKGEIDPLLLERSIRYAIERAQAQEAIKKAHSQLEALHAATAALVKTLDLNSLLGEILDAAQSAFPAAGKGMLHLVEAGTGKLHMRAFHDGASTSLVKEPPLQSDTRIKHFKYGERDGWLFQVMHEKLPLLITDISRPLALPLSDPAPEWRSARSIMVVPMVLDGQVLGTISLTASLPHAFSDSDLRLLQSFATTATAAMKNCILFENEKHSAITDPLTHVLNRRGFFEIGEREFERYQRTFIPLSAIMLDIDHFKAVNDSLGHRAGDQILVDIADRILKKVRKVDVVARYGGDEFSVLLPDSDLINTRIIAERLRDSLIKSPVLNNRKSALLITVSTGVAQAFPAMNGLSALLDRADHALYEAKLAGRNCVRTPS